MKKLDKQLLEQAQLDDAKAQYLLSRYYLDIMDEIPYEKIDETLKLSRSWLQKSSDGGYALAQMQLAKLLLDVDYKPNKAFELFYIAGENGNAEAQFQVGMFYDGEGYDDCDVKPDKQKAFEWYKLSAENGFDEAQYVLGYSYLNGDIVEVDYEKAEFWLRKSAEQNNSYAIIKLAEYYSEIKEDEKTAFELYLKSFDLEQQIACYKLAMCYKDGIGTQKNREKAKEIMYKAVQNGNKDAMYLYTLFCIEDNTEIDILHAIFFLNKAIEWGLESKLENAETKLTELLQAHPELAFITEYSEMRFERYCDAVNGDPKSQFEVGEEYYTECFPPYYEDYRDKILYWYRKSAELGYAEAQYMMGKAYHNELGVPYDFDKAEHWYKLAIEQGNKQAKEALIKLYED